jgi:anti-sigma factor RsiW
MTGEDFVNHPQIEEADMLDRYLLGRLPAEEQSRFEEHFLDCEKCLDRLETSASFRRGIRSAFAEDALRTGVYVRAGVLGWLMRRNRWQQAALFLIAILLLVLPNVFFFMKAMRANAEMVQAKKDSLEWQRQFEAQQTKRDELEKELQQTKQTFGQRLQQTLPDEPGTRRELGRPQAPVPVFALNIVRSADPTSQPANQISIPPSASSVVLLLDLESDSEVRSFRATISTADNRVVWVAKDLKSQSGDTLRVTLKSDLIKPNDYQLALEGLTKAGSYIPQGKYSFRVKAFEQ